jgi:hypothetical protein
MVKKNITASLRLYSIKQKDPRTEELVHQQTIEKLLEVLLDNGYTWEEMPKLLNRIIDITIEKDKE